MAEATHCPECGTELPRGLPIGLCPHCVLANVRLTEPSRPPSPDEGGLSSQLPRGFGDYELLEEIARGGMGVVYKARQKSLDRIVAVKMLLSGSFASDELIRRFKVEAISTASLRHPNIVAVHEVGCLEGQHFLVMDYVDGPNLAKLVRDEPLAPKRAATFVKTIAEAIDYAHEKDILHRDLKPSNILVDSDDQPRVSDFGLARQIDGDSSLTLSGQMLGSPNYMPPEQAAVLHHKVSCQSDVYGLGAILYHLLTGRPPFQGATITDTVHQVLNNEPASPRSLNPNVPLDLETICLKCLEKEPARRYATALEVAAELARYLESEPIHARPVSRPEKIWRWCRRKPLVASLASAVVLVTVVGVVGWIWARDRSRAADSAREKELKILYASDLFLADRALKETNLLQAEEILRGLQEAIDRHPANPALWQARGVMLQKTRALAPAYEHLSRAIELASTNAERPVLDAALFGRSSVLRQMNRVAEAGVDYRRARHLPYPTNVSPMEMPDYQSAWNVNVELGTTDRESGLHLVPEGGDSRHTPALLGNEEARFFKAGWNYGYFWIDPTYKWTLGSTVVVRIEYKSLSGHKLGLHFDGGRDPFSAYDKVVSLPDSGQWQVDEFVLKNIRFKHSQYGGADFRLWDNERGFYLRRVSVFGHNPWSGPEFFPELPRREPDARRKAEFEVARTPRQVAEILRSDSELLVQQAFGDSNSLHVPVVLNVLEESIRRQPTNHVLSLARAKVLTKLGRLNEALDGLSTAIASTTNPNSFPTVHREALLQRSGLLLKIGRYEEAGLDNCRSRSFPLRDPQTPRELLDLSAFYEYDMSWFLGSRHRERLKLFLSQVQQNTGVQFDVRGFVALSGTGVGDVIKATRQSVTNILVNRYCDRLHVLHSASNVEREGTRTGFYILRYADGQLAELPIIYGTHVRSRRDPKISGPLTNAIIGWSGVSDKPESGTKVTVFKATWANPRPTEEVKSLDFVSAMTASFPVLIAITVE